MERQQRSSGVCTEMTLGLETTGKLVLFLCLLDGAAGT